MKRVFTFLFIIIGMILLTTGCSNISKEKYDELELKYNNAIKKDEVDNLSRDINLLKLNKKSLENDISVLQSEKKQLSEEVIKIKGTPKTYPAGYLIVGEDIVVGKYKIYGGKSNFFVHDKYGNLKVNIILGNEYSSLGVQEYIYNFKDGDEVQAESSFNLVSIE